MSLFPSPVLIHSSARFRLLTNKQVAKAQLDEDMCVEAIASYIKAEDPSYYAEVNSTEIILLSLLSVLIGRFGQNSERMFCT